MSMTTPLTPSERMWEIRRLTVLIEALAIAAGHLQEECNFYDIGDASDVDSRVEQLRLAVDEKWRSHDTAVTELLELLHHAEADGSLAECEEMLRVSHAGVR